jgi:hypothetical protein
MMALLTMCFLFVLAISLLSFIEEDGQFAYQQQSSLNAYYLAQTGMIFYQHYTEAFTPNAPVTQTPLAASPNQYWVAQLYSNGDVQSVGVVQTLSGTPVAQRTLYVRQGNFPMIRDVTR